MNWYKVVGVMDDGARIYGEEVILAANSKQEASEKAKRVLHNNAEDVFHTDHVFDLALSWLTFFLSERISPFAKKSFYELR